MNNFINKYITKLEQKKLKYNVNMIISKVKSDQYNYWEMYCYEKTIILGFFVSITCILLTVFKWM